MLKTSLSRDLSPLFDVASQSRDYEGDVTGCMCEQRPKDAASTK